MRDPLHLPAQRHRRALQLPQLGAASEDLRGPQQICHPQRPQTGVHRRHADPAGGCPGRSKQSDERQQPALRAAQDYSFGHQDGRAPLPQHPRPAGDGPPGDRPVQERTALQALSAGDGHVLSGEGGEGALPWD